MAHTSAPDPMFPPQGLQDLLGQTDWIQSLARRLVKDASRAEDVTQEALMAAMRGAPAEGDRLRPWLGGVVRNLAARTRRTEVRRGDTERAAARSERAEDHAAGLAQAEAHRALVNHVLALDERDRVLLVQRYFQGRTPAEIARREGRSPAAISSQLTRAHAALRRRLEAEGGRERWLAGLAPLVSMRSAAPAKVSVGAIALASGGTASLVAAAVAVVVALGVWLMRAPEPGVPDVTLAAHDSEEQAPESLPDSLVAPTEREPLVAPAPVASASLPTGSLHATLLDGDGAPVTDATLHVVCSPDDERDHVLDGDGAWTFRGLPANRALPVFLSVDGVRWPEPIGETTVAPGQTVDESWTVHLTTDVLVTTTDTVGGIVPGQVVILAKPSWSGMELLTNSLAGDQVAKGVTDQDGRFTFTDVPPGKYRVALLDSYATWEDAFEDKVDEDGKPYQLARPPIKGTGCPYARPMTIAPNTETQAESLTVNRGIAITGRIVFPDGKPAPNVSVLARRVGTAGSLRAEGHRDGRFTFPHVLEGTYAFSIIGQPEGWALVEDRRHEAGTGDVELVIHRAARVSGRAIHPEPDTEWDAWVTVLMNESAEKPGSGYSGTIESKEGGTYEFEDLDPGPYRIAIHTKDGRFFAADDSVLLAAGVHAAETNLTLRPAHAVNVTVEGSVGIAIEAFQGGRKVCALGVAAGGSRTLAVPPGPTELRIKAYDDSPAQVQQLDAVPGGSLDLTF